MRFLPLTSPQNRSGVSPVFSPDHRVREVAEGINYRTAAYLSIAAVSTVIGQITAPSSNDHFGVYVYIRGQVSANIYGRVAYSYFHQLGHRNKVFRVSFLYTLPHPPSMQSLALATGDTRRSWVGASAIMRILGSVPLGAPPTSLPRLSAV